MAKTTAEKKITLTLGERISVSTMLPAEGNYGFFIVKKDLLAKVGVSQEELKKYKIETKLSEDQKLSWLTWNEAGTKARFDYEFTELEKNEIKLALTKISNENKLTDSLINLYEIFVGK